MRFATGVQPEPLLGMLANPASMTDMIFWVAGCTSICPSRARQFDRADEVDAKAYVSRQPYTRPP